MVDSLCHLVSDPAVGSKCDLAEAIMSLEQTTAKIGAQNPALAFVLANGD
jgi:hypothetical protein